jgi:hypothetical protein
MFHILRRGEIRMPRVDPQTNKLAKRKLRREKIFTLSRLVSLLGCSSRAAQGRLKLWHTHTSYNKNGKYYVLPEVPSFDQNGLWRYGDVAFSKHGNLKKTIIHLVTVSDAGLSGKQLGDILGVVFTFISPTFFQNKTSCGSAIFSD